MNDSRERIVTTTVGIVSVHYDANKTAATMEVLARIGRLVPIVANILVANQEAAWNSLSYIDHTNIGTPTIIRHDNSGMEFGGYQAGLDRMLNESDPEWVLFANDSFATHQNFGAIYREKLVSALAREVDFPAIVGQVASLPRSYGIEGLRTNRWVTTNIFALNRAALRGLNRRVYREELESLVTETNEIRQFFSTNVDSVLRDHLETWLFSTRPGWHWYAADKLQSKNAGKMARKARSILQEKYLGAFLDALGAEFINLNDLSVKKKVIREIERKLFAFRKPRS